MHPQRAADLQNYISRQLDALGPLGGSWGRILLLGVGHGLGEAAANPCNMPSSVRAPVPPWLTPSWVTSKCACEMSGQVVHAAWCHLHLLQADFPAGATDRGVLAMQRRTRDLDTGGEACGGSSRSKWHPRLGTPFDRALWHHTVGTRRATIIYIVYPQFVIISLRLKAGHSN